MRRNIGRAVGAVVAALLVGHLCAAATPVVISGYVYVDANRNGRRDTGERALGNVPVSDGESIVTSAADGGYKLSLEVNEDRFVLITPPTGFVPTNGFFRRVDSARKEASVTADFGLVPDARWQGPDFSFLVTADSQFNTKEDQALLIEEFREMNAVSGSPAFFFIVGDLTMSGALEELDMYREVAGQITRFPLFNIYGGHDGIACGRNVRNFQIKLGPPYFSWDCGGKHFIALTTETGCLSKEANARQWQWVERDLALQPRQKPVVLACHVALPADVLARWAAQHNIKAVFIGHWHENTVYTQNSVPVLITGPIRGRDWGALTRSFRVCRFRGDELTTELRYTGQDKRLDTVSPPEGGKLVGGRIPIVVDAYDTTSWVREARVTITDSVGKPIECSLKPEGEWSWRGEWDASGAQGVYRVKASVRNDRDEAWQREISVTVAAGASPICKPGTDWPQIVRTFEAGRTTPDVVRPPLTLAWCAPTGGEVWCSSPVVADGRVYIGVEDEDLGWPGAGVAAFDAVTGQRLWKTRTESVRHTVAIEGGRVYALSEQGIVYCLNAPDGRILWKVDAYSPQTTFRGAKSSCVAHKGRVLALCEMDALVALDGGTGKEAWRYPFKAMLRQSCPTVYDDTIYLAGREALACVDFNTGKEKWRTAINVGRGASPPIMADGVLYVSGGTTIACNPNDGRTVWKASTPTGGTYVAFCPTVWQMFLPHRPASGALRATARPADAAKTPGKVFAGGANLVALDAKTGKPIWRHTADLSPKLYTHNKRQVLSGLSAPAVSGNVLYVGSDDGFFYALDAATGRTLWRYHLGVPVKSSPIVSGNAVYVGACDGNLYAFVSSE